MAAPSKNQRSGPKVKTKVATCMKGHAKTWVNYSARGRKNMLALCECDGYKPITTEKKGG